MTQSKLPPKPPLPPKPELEPPKGAWLSILLALGGGSIVLAILSVVTLFYLFPVFAIAALVFLIAAFHYSVWGWWLRGYLEKARPEEVDLASEDNNEQFEPNTIPGGKTRVK